MYHRETAGLGVKIYFHPYSSPVNPTVSFMLPSTSTLGGVKGNNDNDNDYNDDVDDNNKI